MTNWLKMMRVWFLASVIASPAVAGWQRNLGGNGKGSAVDSPPAHPLAYFERDPCLRPDGDGLVSYLECIYPGVPPSQAELERRAKAETELTEVGTIDPFKIYDLWYTTGKDADDPSPDLRSVLVKTGADLYQEIDVSQRMGNLFPASEIVKIDNQPVLIIKSHDGGNNDIIGKKLYVFYRSGPEPADFSAVNTVVRDLLPSYMSIRTQDDVYSASKRVVETYRNDLNLPPVTVTERARITVTYQFLNGRAIVTGSKYEPYSMK